MTVDIEKLEALATAANGFSDVSLAPDVLLELINDSKRIKAELDGVDPCFEDVQRLCKVLGYLGVSIPESGHEQAARWLSLVRNLIRTAETSKLLRQDSQAIAEYSQLKSENAGLKTRYEAYERVNAGLKAECENLRTYGEEFASLAERRREQVEALRKDAERWRFVRNPIATGSPFAIWSERTNLFLGKFADEAIDAAMSKEQSHDN